MDVDKIQDQVTLMLPAITYKEGLSNISVGKLQMGPMPNQNAEAQTPQFDSNTRWCAHGCG